MTESCPACTPLEWGCAALLGEPASSGVLWNSWLQGQDTSILQSGRCKGAGHTQVLALIKLHKEKQQWEDSQTGRQTFIGTIHQKGCTASAGVKTWLSNHFYTSLPERAAYGMQGREVVSLCNGCTPSAVEGRGAVIQSCLCVCCIFCKDPQHPTLPPPLCLASMICSYNVGTHVPTPSSPLTEGSPQTQICTWLSWSHMLVWAWSNSPELERGWVQNPSQVVRCLLLREARQAFRWCFWTVKFGLCVCVWKYMIKQHCKAAVVKQAALFKLCKCKKATSITQYGKYCSHKPFLCPFRTSLSYLK